MSWRQYDNLFDDIKNVAYKATLAPIVRKINSSRTLHKANLLPARIVICACPRSGTTLMNELLRCYDDVYVASREEFALHFPYLVLGKKYLVTKYPLDFRELDKIIDTFNNPFVIYLVRDPRDVIISGHFKNEGRYLINYPTWVEAMEAYENFDYDNKILVHYEDLIKDPESIQQQIAKAANLEIKSDFNNFHTNVVQTHEDIKSLGGIRPIDSKNSGKFMKPEHFDRIREQLQENPDMSERLIKYGYEKDSEWEKHFLS